MTTLYKRLCDVGACEIAETYKGLTIKQAYAKLARLTLSNRSYYARFYVRHVLKDRVTANLAYDKEFLVGENSNPKASWAILKERILLAHPSLRSQK